jgi:hypothetical protein
MNPVNWAPICILYTNLCIEHSLREYSRTPNNYFVRVSHQDRNGTFCSLAHVLCWSSDALTLVRLDILLKALKQHPL